nr:MAG: ORF1 [TTV-like mini virus]UGV36979.1 MAG: ORF1 [TTV-like mini virus]UGV38273.1 MAG: ORF1 [TTV-like mini virus]
MPWFYNRPYYRRRRYWRRRPRRFIRRKLWRRRRRRYYGVRPKRKLSYLHLKEWQPPYIKKLKIEGTMPLYLTTSERTDHNLRLYEDENVPHLLPGGGGWSITTFSLNAFYQAFLKSRCWWTQSNNQYPLIRYTGARITLFRSDSSDYIVRTHRCFPMIPKLETYNATQPNLLLLAKHHTVIRCKKYNYSKKPYKVLKFKPPSQLTNKWFFQKDLADTPLLFMMASATSLDRFYLASNSQSTTTGFSGLNPEVFQYHHFTQQTTSGYTPRNGLYLWTCQQGTQSPSLTNLQIQNCIFLGNTQKYQVGTTINDVPETPWSTKKQKYQEIPDYWGNLFIPWYLTGTAPLFATSDSLHSTLSKATNGTETLQSLGFRQFQVPLIINYRYNSFRDTSINNRIYLVDTENFEQNWDPPRDESLQNNNLTLWLGLWGFLDWQKLKKTADTVDNKKLLVIQTNFTTPHSQHIIPIDQDFLNGDSPYTTKYRSPADSLHWHPKVRFQYRSVNAICNTGPGVIKLPQNVSAEAHCKYCFYFKLGGCSQETKDIESPAIQPDYPIPNNTIASTSLQSPTTPVENYLYSFDWKRHYLTKSAAERIIKHAATEMPPFTPTGVNLFNPPAATETSSEDEETTPEKEKETIQSLLKQLRHRQRQYKQRILQLTGLL